jgi:HSP20 family protein
MLRRESGLARRGGESGIARFDPWTEFESMRTRMDDLFSRVFGFTPLNRLIGPATFEPMIDICENNESILVNVYVPGLEKDDVDLNVTSDSITVSGEWKHAHGDEEGMVCHVTGLATGKFQSTYGLPVEIDPQKSKAVYKNGVLSVTLPKTEAHKTKPIKIEVQE